MNSPGLGVKLLRCLGNIGSVLPSADTSGQSGGAAEPKYAIKRKRLKYCSTSKSVFMLSVDGLVGTNFRPLERTQRSASEMLRSSGIQTTDTPVLSTPVTSFVP